MTSQQTKQQGIWGIYGEIAKVHKDVVHKVVNFRRMEGEQYSLSGTLASNEKFYGLMGRGSSHGDQPHTID